MDGAGSRKADRLRPSALACSSVVSGALDIGVVFDHPLDLCVGQRGAVIFARRADVVGETLALGLAMGGEEAGERRRRFHLHVPLQNTKDATGQTALVYVLGAIIRPRDLCLGRTALAQAPGLALLPLVVEDVVAKLQRCRGLRRRPLSESVVFLKHAPKVVSLFLKDPSSVRANVG